MLESDLHTYEAPFDSDYVGDKLHTLEEKEILHTIDHTVKDLGLCMIQGVRNEGPCIRYYKGSASTYSYALNEVDGHLQWEFRIPHVDRCLSYLEECPESVKNGFRQSDPGCENRVKGTCRSSIKYEYEGKECWHCGCCGAPFHLNPVKEDIPYVMKLMEIGK